MSAPSMLYHYTSYQNAISILESATIRAFRSNTMNDPAEVTYGLDIYLETLRSLLDEATTDEARERIGFYYIDALKVFNYKDPTAFNTELGERLGIPSMGAWFLSLQQKLGFNHPGTRSVYMVSLSESPLNLDSWRSYGADGTGLALGIDVNILKRGAINQRVWKGWNLDKVTYGASTIESVTRAHLHRSNPGRTTNFWNSARKIYRLIVHSKHECYASEQEWRLYTFTKPGDVTPEFAHSSNRPRPYIPITFSGNHPIREIWTGPCSSFRGDQDEAWHEYLQSRADWKALFDDQDVSNFENAYVQPHHADLPYRRL